MKKIFFVFIVLLLVVFCHAQTNVFADKENKRTFGSLPDTSELHTVRFISKSEAETILKNRVFVKDSLLRFLKNGYIIFSFTYKVNTRDTSVIVTDEVPTLWFGLDQHDLPSTTQRIFTLLQKENKNIYTVNELENLGEAAYWISDKKSFIVVMVIKGNRIYKIRMDHAISQASTDAILLLARKIVVAH